MNEVINTGGVCRTALATQCLLNIDSRRFVTEPWHTPHSVMANASQSNDKLLEPRGLF